MTFSALTLCTSRRRWPLFRWASGALDSQSGGRGPVSLNIGLDCQMGTGHDWWLIPKGRFCEAAGKELVPECFLMARFESRLQNVPEISPGNELEWAR